MEIPSIRDHLLQECDKKDELRQCLRCKQVVHRDQFEEHTQKQACMDNPDDKPVCPLCEADVTRVTKIDGRQEAWL